jgi:hypothetical protein
MHSYSHAFAIALGEENERRGSGGFVEVTGEKGTFIRPAAKVIFSDQAR